MNDPDIAAAICAGADHAVTMFCRLYIEALLRDRVRADLVWQAWHDGLLTDELAMIAWWLVAIQAARLNTNDKVLNRAPATK